MVAYEEGGSRYMSFDDLDFHGNGPKGAGAGWVNLRPAGLLRPTSQSDVR
jgi:hypothetical protein